MPASTRTDVHVAEYSKKKHFKRWQKRIVLFVGENEWKMNCIQTFSVQQHAKCK